MGHPGVEMKVSPFTVNVSDPLEKCLLPSPRALGTAGLEVLVPKGVILPLEDPTVIPPRN